MSGLLGRGMLVYVLLLYSIFSLFTGCNQKESGEHFKLGPSLNIPRASHSATLLKDGRVLIAGGFTMGHPQFPKGDVVQAEIYDPKTNQFILGDKLKVVPVSSHPVSLTDGTIVFIGHKVQIFNPKNEKFTV
ncbi:MAG TPA: kelch repeat-containing protein, partial [Bdellovibrio sp.]|nr:kelch repeat-containing protein [Bdellovibrio sp.]